MFRILIIEENATQPVATATAIALPMLEIERYSQRVDVIDLQSVIRAVNTPPRAPRKDKGSSRTPKPE